MSALRILSLVLLLAVGAANGQTSEKATVVIAHGEVSQQVLTQRQLQRIFMLKQRAWGDGQAISLIVFSSDSQQHSAFLRQHLKMFPYQLEREWNKLIYSGQSAPPVVATDPETMLELVASTPGAIGYLVGTTPSAAVNVIEVNRE